MDRHSPSHPPLAALLFDLDGTLAETDSLHFEAFRRLFAEIGRDLDVAGYRRSISGRANADVLAGFFPDMPVPEREAFADRKEALFRTMAGRLRPLPGAREVLDWGTREGLKLALVTSAPPKNIDFVLKAFALESTFDLIVYGEQLPRRKPDPLAYTSALEGLEVTAEQAIAFEDSPAGVRSAVGAKVLTVGLTTTHDAKILEAEGAHIAVPDYTDASLWRLLETALAATSGD